MTWADRIDSLISIVSPSRGLQRKAARAQMQFIDRRRDRMLGAWDAADRERERGSNWMASRLSIDAQSQEDLETTRDRARESLANDPYAASYSDSFVTNTVGREIRVQSRIRAVEGDALLTEENVKKLNKELEDLWRRQSESLGADGESSHELQQLAMRQWSVDGEILTMFSDVEDKGRPVPLAVQVVDAARLQSPLGKPENKIVMGVERDAGNRRVVAFHFRRGVVGDNVRDSQEYDRIDADRVCHVFTKLHPDQTRGIPPLRPVLTRLKDIRDYQEAELAVQQTAALYGVVIKTPNPMGMAEGNAKLVDSRGNPVEELSPASVTYLNNGSDVVFGNPQRPGGAVGQFTDTNLRAVAAGSNTPAEIIGKDYSKTTYSSGRLSLIDGRLNYQLAQCNFIRGYCRPLWTEFVKQAVMLGLTSIDIRDFARRPWAYDRGQWMPPGWPWIDPQKDVQASVEALAGNLTTLSDELAARGIDLEEFVETRKREIDMLAKAGIPDATVPQAPPANDPNQPNGQPNNQPGEQQYSSRELRSLRNAISSLTDHLERLGVFA